MPTGNLVLASFVVPSERLDSPRQVWVQMPPAGPVTQAVVFLDGELYTERVKAPEIVAALQAESHLATTACIYVSYADPVARHAELTCNVEFAEFLVADLTGWIERNVGTCRRLFLCGLSLSGLEAAFAARSYPAVFAGAICQSPSAWWNDEWLTAAVGNEAAYGGRLWLSVGDREREAGVSHPPSGLRQDTSQLDSVRRLAKALAGMGKNLHYTEFSGGHDPACWAAELPAALLWLVEMA